MIDQETLVQDETHLERSRALSSVRPPAAEVPGFHLERPLGRGAFGEVWLAVESHTGRRVAIKFFSRHRGLDWPLLRREVGKLIEVSTDRRIVNLLQVGHDAEHPYYVMEYLEGGSLADRLANGPLEVEEAVRIFRLVVEALTFLHGKAVLHCDLKPGNVLLDGRGDVRLADFGQARMSQEEGPGVGTLFFMAPEQAQTQARPDVRSDIYSLGALFYAMLTGRPPHADGPASSSLQRSTSVDEKLLAYQEFFEHAEPPTDHHRIPGVDRRLAEIADRCLHPDPDQRYENVAQVLDDLNDRARRRTRRPLLIFGIFGPLILLASLAAVGLWLFNSFSAKARDALLEQTFEAHLDLARLSAAALDDDLSAVERRVRRAAGDEALLQAIQEERYEELQRRLDDLWQAYRKRAFEGWELTLRRGITLHAPQEFNLRTEAWRDPETGVLAPLAVPVSVDGEEIGMLSIALRTTEFQSWLAHAEDLEEHSAAGCPDVQVLVVFGDQLLRHPCPDPQAPALPVDAEHFVARESVRALLAEGKSEAFQDPMRRDDPDLATAVRLQEHPRWSVIIAQDRGDALSSIDELTQRLRPLGGIAVGLGFLVLGGLLVVLFRLDRRSAG